LWKSAIDVLKKKNFKKEFKFKDRVLCQISEPIGVVGLIIPWNYPFIVTCERLPFIIAAGCPVILKPSEFASASMIHIVNAINMSSAPKQLINLVHGRGKRIGRALVSNKKINMISFTGSTAVAKDIIKSSITSIKKLSLELGGKNPMVITADANINKSTNYVMENFLENGGQACIAGSILYIEEKIYDQVKNILIKKLNFIKNYQYPITNQHNRIIKKKIISSLKNGSSLVFGNKEDLKNNKPILPYILENVNVKENLFVEEVFGTILILKKFKKISSLIDSLNQNKYGLAVYLYSNKINDINYFKDKIRYGRVWINCSLKYWNSKLTIGGFRDSGYGSETSSEGLDNYTVNKSIIS
ncbi:aldehyde dehydrogenase family protein, partial [Pelagibacteraceae bacterium]|nr:aldehyde dehydrogenase family protein [Pelagibacteraceae bacterium]